MNIEYTDNRDPESWFNKVLNRYLSSDVIKSVCDVGGGANPIIAQEMIDGNAIDYTLLDISQGELDKAPAQYNKVCANILDSNALPHQSWDLVVSTTLAEHVKDGRAFHENIFQCLKPGGYAIHLFPTLFAIPFVANKIMPEALASRVMDIVAPRDRYQYDKFPAYYSWCFGPTPKMLNRLNSIGYEIINYVGFYGHGYYYRLPWLHELQLRYGAFMVKKKFPYQTTYAITVLRKPVATTFT